MSAKTQIQIAGGFSAFFFLFHIPFYWMFDWKHSLACLSRDNWAIFHCFNVISISLLLLMAFTSLFHAEELRQTKVGRWLVVFCAWFYAFRILAEFILFKENSVLVSGAIVVLCGLPALLYATALRSTQKLKGHYHAN